MLIIYYRKICFVFRAIFIWKKLRMTSAADQEIELTNLTEIILYKFKWLLMKISWNFPHTYCTCCHIERSEISYLFVTQIPHIRSE